MTAFKHVHASGRYARTPKTLTASLDHFKALGASVITGTEADDPARNHAVRRWARANGWGVQSRTQGTPFPNDAYVVWDKTVWSLVHKEHFKTTNRTWLGGADGTVTVPGQYAAYAVLEHVATKNRVVFSSTHTPSAVQSGPRWSVNARAVASWNGSLRGWQLRTNALQDQYAAKASVISADWNVDLHNPFFRGVLKAAFPGRRLCWTGRMPAKGTFSNGDLIDASLLNGNLRVAAIDVLRDRVTVASSDHRAFIETLVFG